MRDGLEKDISHVLVSQIEGFDFNLKTTGSCDFKQKGESRLLVSKVI